MVVKFWAPEAGWVKATLRRRAVRRLWHCQKGDGPNRAGGCCRRLVSSLEFGDRQACKYWMAWTEFDGPLAETCDASARDLVCTPATLKWLSETLRVDLPPWFDAWQKAVRPSTLSISPAPADKGEDGGDVLTALLQRYPGGKGHPRKFKGFYDEFRDRSQGPDKVLTDPGIRSRIRRHRPSPEK